MTPFNPRSTDRLDILKRFLRTVVCMVAFELVKILTYATIFVQYAILLVTGSHLEPLRNFGKKLSGYGYEILRYATLTSNRRPFPFSDLPADRDCESSTSDIDYS